MTASDKGRLDLAAVLIAKAQGSSVADEQHAFALRAYSCLAQFLNSLELGEAGAGRRRERRLVRDRRGAGRAVEDEKPTVINLRSQEAGGAYRAVPVSSTGTRLDVGL